MTIAKRKTGTKKEINYTVMIFLVIVVFAVGIGLGYHLFTPKETETAPPTTTLIGEIVTEGKIVKVDYIGKFENGTVFDTSLEDEAKLAGIYQEGRPYEPFSFPVGKGQAIEGFEEAVLGMKVGEEIEVTIPPEKAYSSGPLAGKTLLFKIWVREIKEPVKVQLTIVNDPNCGTECDTTRILETTEMVFPGVEVKEVDANSEEGQKLIEKYEILLLPAYLLSENIVEAENYANNAMAFEKKGDGYMLRVDLSGATHYLSEEAEKEAEEKAKREREKAEEERAKQLSEKIKPREKPQVEVFVMSYCPYGTQMEKGILPIAKLLGDKIDFSMKFVYYAMHGKKELDEQTLEYCLQKEQRDKYLDYLGCFLKEGDTAGCLTETEIDKEKLDICIKETDEKFEITESYEDKTTWLNGRFPLFDVNKEENEKYEVGGSPAIAINEASISVGRDPASLLQAICLGFKDKPKECEKELSSSTPNPGFGFSASVESDSPDASGVC